MGSVERSLGNQIIARAQSLRDGAVTAAIVWGIAILIVLGFALFFTVIVARSMVRPLRRLRAGALEVAGMRLPETVRRMSEGEGADAPLEVEPIDVDSTDEIGEVARAFDQVHREAVRLASNEAALRGNVNAMFVNLSRRSQSLVERQIRLIDDLEQGEQDSERLGNLFQMDHLATRMRRNSENLLVLAGHDVSRRWTQAVGLVDVLRAAVSEIEQYERVTLNVQPGIAVRGQAVNDVVHLLAELVENATSFSAADTPVNVAGHLLNSGGVLLDITDQGVGMGAEEMAHANWRLDNPPVVDVAVSRRMGLFVVARLAARHGIRVRLRPASMGGLTALVWLPDEVITHETSAAPGLRRFEVTTPGAAAAAAATPARMAEWPEPGQSEDRSAAMEAVSAARTPRFTPLRPDLSRQRHRELLGPGCGRYRPGHRCQRADAGLRRQVRGRARSWHDAVEYRTGPAARVRRSDRDHEPRAGRAQGRRSGVAHVPYRDKPARTAWRDRAPCGEHGRGESAANIRVRGIRLVPPGPAWCRPSCGPGGERGRRRGLDLTRGRGLGSRGSGARAGLGWYHCGRAAQARAQGKSCSWRGRRDLSGATSASQVSGTDERASCQLPAGSPRGASDLARRPDSGQ